MTRDVCAPPFSKQKILKNVFVVSLGSTVLFTAFQGISNLQTSLNREEGVGSISLSLIYASFILSCLLLPKFIIAKLGCKWTIPLSMIGYVLYMGANFYAVKGTMFVTAITLGMGAAPLWSAKCTYLTQVGMWYARLTKQESDVIINRFFGAFYSLFQTSQIWGNLISAEVFTRTRNESVLDNVCGANFCGNDTSNFDQNKDNVYIVCSIYLACGIAGVTIVSIFLDPIKLDQESSDEDRTLNPRLMMSTFKHVISSPIQIMLIPITLYGGVALAFLTGVYTKAYISCSLGIWNLGYVMMCYGVVTAACSFLFGHLVKYIGHIPLFFLAFVVHGGLQITLLLWAPSRDQEILFYVFAGLWGVGTAVTSTQLSALYGDIFNENAEAGFANLKLWESVGYTIAFAYSDLLCTDTKLYVCLGVLVAAAVGYISAEVSFHMKKRGSMKISGDNEGFEPE